MGLSRCGLWFAVLTPLMAQEANSGFTLPVTLSAGMMHSHRWREESPSSGPVQFAFRAMLYPSLKLSDNWFAYSAIQVSSSPYFSFEAYSANKEIEIRPIQAFLGYTRTSDKGSITVMAGHLATAFGSFPPRYDDTENPLLGTPLSYGDAEYGSMPVTLYGVPGIELNASLGRLDARFQVTNSSPANPKKLWSDDQYFNWAAGGGYTIRRALRIGGSIYHGPYLQVGRFLSPSENASNWPFTAVGIDGQWARGRWSVSGEWQRFYFLYPRFRLSPVVKYGYIETKAKLSPRVYIATRVGLNSFSAFQPIEMPAPAMLHPNRESVEIAIGYRLRRNHLVKIGYEWLHDDGQLDTRNNIFGVQIVTSINALTRAFH